MDFDFCHAVPSMSAPDIIKHSELKDSNNPYGYVEIDKHTMQHIRFPNVFLWEIAPTLHVARLVLRLKTSPGGCQRFVFYGQQPAGRKV